MSAHTYRTRHSLWPLLLGGIARGVLYCVLIAGGITMLVPFFWMVSTSLKDLPDVFKWPPQWIPPQPMWENYLIVFKRVPFARYFLNTVLVSTCRTLGIVLTSSLAGYAFARLRFPGRDALFLLYLGTMMIPGQVTMIPSFILMRILHWIDTFYALIVPGLFSAFGTFLMRQFFLTIPVSLMEAATIDGCNPLGVFRRIALPLARPALATLTIFTFMGAWNDFMWPLIVTHSPNMRVINVGISAFQDLYMTEWTYMMAAAVMALIPVLAVYFTAQRYFVQGIALTGIKG